MDGTTVFDSGWGMTSIHQVRFCILGFTVDHGDPQPQSFSKWLGPVKGQTQNLFSTFFPCGSTKPFWHKPRNRQERRNRATNATPNPVNRVGMSIYNQIYIISRPPGNFAEAPYSGPGPLVENQCLTLSSFLKYKLCTSPLLKLFMNHLYFLPLLCLFYIDVLMLFVRQIYITMWQTMFF